MAATYSTPCPISHNKIKFQVYPSSPNPYEQTTTSFPSPFQQMEGTFVHALSFAKPSSLLNSPLLLHLNATSVAFSSVPHHHLPKRFLFQPPSGVRYIAKERKNLGVVHASEAANPTTNDSEKWLLEPVGDGDSRHIGFKVEMPGAYVIASSEVTVGRVPDKADLVIPVATVSGVHARIQKKQGNLLVTDLDSTNGTFINEKRLRPGVVTTISSGSVIIFGDTHLAMFRVSKVEDVMAADAGVETEIEPDTAADADVETEIEPDTDNKRDDTETS